MNLCLNKLLESINQVYEVTFQKMIEILYRGGIIRPHIGRAVIPTLELQPIDHSLKQPLTLHSCSSTPVFTKSESIYRRAESEKEFKKCIIPNLGDTINKVECYSKDISLLNLFDDKQEVNPNTNQFDNNNVRYQLQPITEEHKNLKNSKIIKTKLIIQSKINKEIKILKNKYHKISFIQQQIIQTRSLNPNNFLALQIEVLLDIASIRIKQENDVILSLNNYIIQFQFKYDLI
ncbi:unnamed protein product [Paramecium octaurelia]|uniref:Uncharacterized protein n=1 Tax=Paramecium octaurelia TaxID=43137 RepID=A0A8S1SRY0_PAROT|nr:unnamed protein product [Paramecium octaurelia]